MILLDTNIVIKYIRKYSIVPEECFISIVTVGELKSFALKKKWGKQKLESLQINLGRLHVLDISHNITNIYAEIDTFSQGLLPEKKLNASARNSGTPPVGKNDIWIAATASYFDIPLQTTDNDYDHLPDFGLKLDKVSP